MTRPSLPPRAAKPNLNHMRRGLTYQATTRRGGSTTGEYLGIEVAYDNWAILLRHETGTDAIAVDDLTSVHAVAA